VLNTFATRRGDGQRYEKIEVDGFGRQVPMQGRQDWLARAQDGG
jgi:hypothetical protein